MQGCWERTNELQAWNEPRFGWTTFARADGNDYKALILWLPVGYATPVFQFCPVEYSGGSGIGTWTWTWDGDIEAPTLQESIRCNLNPPAIQWHGHVRKGHWIPC